MGMGYQLSGDSWVKPDVSVTQAGQRVDEYLQGAPAIAIEVVSPSNTAETLSDKTDLYFEYGALEVWRVYPKARKIEIHAAGGSRAVRGSESLGE